MTGLAKRFASVCAVSAAMALIAACGGSGQAPLGEVEGTVTINGKPADNVEVSFLPEGGENAPRSTAITDKEGHYKLVCDDQRPGAMVGDHRVVVKDLARYGDTFYGREKDSDRDPTAEGAPTTPLNTKPRFRAAYESPENTPLKRTVKAEKQTIDLELEPR